MPRILVVDDERSSREITAKQLRSAGYVAEAVDDGRSALARLELSSFDVVLADLRMPGIDGLTLLKEVRRRAPEVDVVVMTAYATIDTAVAAMQEGAADYLTKPFRFAELEVHLRRLEQARQSRDELARLRAMLGDDEGHLGLLGRASGVLRARERIRLFADNAAPVLVTGETGTGKELAARAIHELGPRKAGPFVAVPCGAIPRELAESQLFGHEKGAFTGAIARHTGCFEEAGGGTLLLDDADDLPLDIQVKLLRVLQEGVLRRVGGSHDVHVDTRVIATTKVDLTQAVAAGTFRDDLFYRLRGLEIHLPPLRERGDDVLLLAEHFLRGIAEASQEEPRALSIEAADVLRRYAWPGNVRELRRVVESAVALCREPRIGAAHLPEHLRLDEAEDHLFTLHLGHRPHVDLPRLVAEVEREAIRWALDAAQGQQTCAAQMLGVPRTTLQSKLLRK